MRIMRLDDPRELASYDTPDGWQRLSREEIARQAPQHALVAVHDGALVARCSLWWNDVPALGDDRLGVIGHYGALDRAAALAMLDAACGVLAEQGCTCAVGPMDGNTWQRYRLVVERGTEPPFFLEPVNPAEWPTHFADAGFSPRAWYLSALNDDLGQRDPRAVAVADRLAETGVTVRELDPLCFDEELARIYRVAVKSFQDAFLYTPLSEAAFTSQYRAIQPLVRPELVLLAERRRGPRRIRVQRARRARGRERCAAEDGRVQDVGDPSRPARVLRARKPPGGSHACVGASARLHARHPRADPRVQPLARDERTDRPHDAALRAVRARARD